MLKLGQSNFGAYAFAGNIDSQQCSKSATEFKAGIRKIYYKTYDRKELQNFGKYKFNGGSHL